MKKLMIIPMIALALMLGSIALAQTDQPIPSPIGAHVLSITPSAMASPATMPGGLYRLGNGYLSCPETIPMINGQPNLRACNYVKDVH